MSFFEKLFTDFTPQVALERINKATSSSQLEDVMKDIVNKQDERFYTKEICTAVLDQKNLLYKDNVWNVMKFWLKVSRMNEHVESPASSSIETSSCIHVYVGYSVFFRHLVDDLFPQCSDCLKAETVIELVVSTVVKLSISPYDQDFFTSFLNVCLACVGEEAFATFARALRMIFETDSTSLPAFCAVPGVYEFVIQFFEVSDFLAASDYEDLLCFFTSHSPSPFQHLGCLQKLLNQMCKSLEKTIDAADLDRFKVMVETQFVVLKLISSSTLAGLVEQVKTEEYSWLLNRMNDDFDLPQHYQSFIAQNLLAKMQVEAEEELVEQVLSVVATILPRIHLVSDVDLLIKLLILASTKCKSRKNVACLTKIVLSSDSLKEQLLGKDISTAEALISALPYADQSIISLLQFLVCQAAESEMKANLLKELGTETFVSMLREQFQDDHDDENLESVTSELNSEIRFAELLHLSQHHQVRIRDKHLRHLARSGIGKENLMTEADRTVLVQLFPSQGDIVNSIVRLRDKLEHSQHEPRVNELLLKVKDILLDSAVIFSPSEIELQLQTRLGVGTSCSVYAGWLRRDRKAPVRCAVKLFENFEHGIAECKNYCVLTKCSATSSYHCKLLGVTVENSPNPALALVLERADSDFHTLSSHPLSLADILNYSKQIAGCLDFLHKNSFVHCDLKPENILVFGDEETRQVQLKLTDFTFGIEMKNRQYRGGPDLTTTDKSRVVGTPSYSPPEYVVSRKQNAKTPVSTAFDVYSFGIILLQLLIRRYCTQSNSSRDETFEHFGQVLDQNIDKVIAGDNEVENVCDEHSLNMLRMQPTDEKLVDLCKSCLMVKAEKRPKDGSVLLLALADCSAFLQGHESSNATTANRLQTNVAKGRSDYAPDL